MKLHEIFREKKCPFAVEVFPPKRHSRVESVYQMLRELRTVPADYISVTYSAGGMGASEYTAQISGYLKNELNIEPLAHLTCLYSTKCQVRRELDVLRAAGAENILALRGDTRPGQPPLTDFTYASDLMRFIREDGGFYLVGACYPEGHPQGGGIEQDINCLREKQESGAGHLISQLFFSNDKFFTFLNKVRKERISLPIEAGVMPIVRPEQIARTVSLSSASLPSAFTRWVSLYSGQPEAFYQAGIHYAINQIRQLISQGADGVHLYAMNDSQVAQLVYNGVKDLL